MSPNQPPDTISRVAILDRISGGDLEAEVLGPSASVECYCALTDADLPSDISEVDVAIVWNYLTVGPLVLARLNSCRAIIRAGVGYDNVDLGTASELGIPVVNIPDYGTNDVADHAMALLLAAARGLFACDRALAEDLTSGWSFDQTHELRRLTERHLGIVGFGRIGSAVAYRARAFGMRIAFYDPHLPAGVEKSWQVRRFSSLQDLFADSDIVSLHTPSADETRNSINEAVLNAAPHGLILVNTARGDLVDMAAVERALDTGRLRCFATDVLPVEPPMNGGVLKARYSDRDPSLASRLIVTPHSAIQSRECMSELRVKSAEAARDVLLRRPLRNCVNQHMLKLTRPENDRGFPSEPFRGVLAS